jgi:hypothetical protein
MEKNKKGESLASGRLTFRRKIILGGTAYGAAPFFGEFFKSGPGFDPAFRIPYGRVVNIATNIAGVLFHLLFSFLVLILWPHRKAGKTDSWREFHSHRSRDSPLQL